MQFYAVKSPPPLIQSINFQLHYLQYIRSLTSLFFILDNQYILSFFPEVADNIMLPYLCSSLGGKKLQLPRQTTGCHGNEKKANKYLLIFTVYIIAITTLTPAAEVISMKLLT